MTTNAQGRPAENGTAPEAARHATQHPTGPGPRLTWYGAAILEPAGVRPIVARRRPDLGKARRRIARAALAAAAARRDWATLSSDARLIYALSLLLADPAGRVGLADTAAALADPDAVACALDLLDKAGAS